MFIVADLVSLIGYNVLMLNTNNNKWQDRRLFSKGIKTHKSNIFLDLFYSISAIEKRKDSLQGLVVLIGALLCQIFIGGITLSNGIFYTLYRDAFPDTSSVVASLLCSLPLTLWFMAGTLRIEKNP